MISFEWVFSIMMKEDTPMTQLQIEIPLEELKAFCSKWKIKEFSVFGSVLREDFGPNSDVDVLITHEETATWSLFDLVDMKTELESLLSRKVDWVTKPSVEKSRNRFWKQAVLESARVIHAA